MWENAISAVRGCPKYEERDIKSRDGVDHTDEEFDAENIVACVARDVLGVEG